MIDIGLQKFGIYASAFSAISTTLFSFLIWRVDRRRSRREEMELAKQKLRVQLEAVGPTSYQGSHFELLHACETINRRFPGFSWDLLDEVHEYRIRQPRDSSFPSVPVVIRNLHGLFPGSDWPSVEHWNRISEVQLKHPRPPH